MLIYNVSYTVCTFFRRFSMELIFGGICLASLMIGVGLFLSFRNKEGKSQDPQEHLAVTAKHLTLEDKIRNGIVVLCRHTKGKMTARAIYNALHRMGFNEPCSLKRFQNILNTRIPIQVHLPTRNEAKSARDRRRQTLYSSV